jgi:hypothetical protein
MGRASQDSERAAFSIWHYVLGNKEINNPQKVTICSIRPTAIEISL